MKNVHVRNIESAKGNTIANQFIITTEDGQYFQSYNSIIAFIPHIGKVQLDSNTWNYSRTTARYRSLFLGESTKITENKIADGVYELVDLN